MLVVVLAVLALVDIDVDVIVVDDLDELVDDIVLIRYCWWGSMSMSLCYLKL